MKKIAILTSGGDAPGMNAAIRAIVRAGFCQQLKVTGVLNGYNGLINNEFIPLDERSVSHILGRGGTILHSSRSAGFMTKEGRQQAYDHLKDANIDALITIGGNGTLAGAEIFHQEFGIPVIGLPGSIDNDLAGTDYSIGFDTATNTAVEALDKIRDTATSHNRLFFAEVMGRNSGFIALKVGIAAGAIAVALPEEPFSVNKLIETLDEGRKNGKKSSIVVVSEGNTTGDATFLANEVAKLRPAYDIRVTVLGHVQRGGAPSCYDRVLASQLGASAVNALIEGKTCHMVGLINQQVQITPISIAIAGQNQLNDSEVKLAKLLAI